MIRLFENIIPSILICCFSIFNTRIVCAESEQFQHRACTLEEESIQILYQRPHMDENSWSMISKASPLFVNGDIEVTDEYRVQPVRFYTSLTQLLFGNKIWLIANWKNTKGDCSFLFLPQYSFGKNHWIFSQGEIVRLFLGDFEVMGPATMELPSLTGKTKVLDYDFHYMFRAFLEDMKTISFYQICTISPLGPLNQQPYVVFSIKYHIKNSKNQAK